MKNKLIIRIGIFIAGVLLFLFLFIEGGWFHVREMPDLKKQAVRNTLIYGPYIENMKGTRLIDYNIAEEKDFDSYKDYLEYNFVTEEAINKYNYKNFRYLVIGNTQSAMGNMGYVGLLVDRNSQIPCGHIISK